MSTCQKLRQTLWECSKKSGDFYTDVITRNTLNIHEENLPSLVKNGPLSAV